jgi:hypothetical protein
MREFWEAHPFGLMGRGTYKSQNGKKIAPLNFTLKIFISLIPGNMYGAGEHSINKFQFIFEGL